MWFFGGMVAWLDVYPANGVNEKGFIVKFIKHHFQIPVSLKEVNCAERIKDLILYVMMVLRSSIMSLGSTFFNFF